MSSAYAQDELKKSGTIEIDQLQVALLISGNVGGGKLTFEGKTYEFTVGGLGVGGIGVASIDAKGIVYNLNKLEDFEGVYGQARAGIVVGTAGTGNFWLENPSGVYIELESERSGLALSLGADGVVIDFD